MPKMCSYKFHKIHKKEHVLDSQFQRSCRSITSNFIKIETLAQAFSCAFCEVSHNIFFMEPLLTVASAQSIGLFTVPSRPYVLSKTMPPIFLGVCFRLEQELTQYFNPLCLITDDVA